MQGAARMVLEGQHPAIIRNAVATPGGCTIGGLLTMEDGKIRSTMVHSLSVLFLRSLGPDHSRSYQCGECLGENAEIVS